MAEDPRATRHAALTRQLAVVRRRFAAEGGTAAALRAVVRAGAALVEGKCSLRLLSKDGEHLVFTVGATFGSDADEAPQPIEREHPLRLDSNNITTHVIRSATPALLGAAGETGPRGAAAIYQETIQRLGLHSLIVVPVMSQGQILGVVHFAVAAPAEPLIADDLEPALAVADELGLLLAAGRDLDNPGEQAQRVAEAMPFRTVLEAIPDAVVVVTEAGRIVMVNAETRRLFGYATESLIGRPVEVLLPATARAGHAVHRETYIGSPRIRPMGTGGTLSGVREDGSTVPVEVMLSPCEVDGRPHVIAVIRAIAERRAREAAVQQDLADRRLLFELGEFARVTADGDALAREVARRLAEHLEVTRCIITANLPALGIARTIGVWQGAEAPLTVSDFPLSAYSRSTVADLEAGKLVTVDDMNTDPRTAEYIEVYRRTGIAAWVSVPLMRAGEWVATLGVSTPTPRVWTDRELAFLQRIAERLQQWRESIDMVQALRDLGQQLEQRVEERTVALRESVREKDVLLREVHHRVKNNLQVISSILKLQAFQYGDERVKASFRACQARVQAIALVHDKLYRLPNLARVAFADYARSLIDTLAGAHDAAGRQIIVEAALDPVEVSIEHAIPAGLVLNELLTNAFKHAFPGRGRGHIGVSLSRAGAQVRLTVRDDGVGLGQIDPGHASSFGLDLVYTFAEQLGAAIDVDRAGGTAFTLDFQGAIE